MKSRSPILGEGGAVLVTCLLIMIILSLMGTAAVQMSMTDVRISKNYKDSVQALYAAESGLEIVYDSFIQGNDLDVDATADFTQVYPSSGAATTLPIGYDANDDANTRMTLNSGLNNQAQVWVDVSNSPVSVMIYSRGNPAGTNSVKELAQTVEASALSIINGAINNAP